MGDKLCAKKSTESLQMHLAVFLYCCPDCLSCLAHLNSVGWAAWAIWAAAGTEFSPYVVAVNALSLRKGISVHYVSLFLLQYFSSVSTIMYVVVQWSCSLCVLLLIYANTILWLTSHSAMTGRRSFIHTHTCYSSILFCHISRLVIDVEASQQKFYLVHTLQAKCMSSTPLCIIMMENKSFLHSPSLAILENVTQIQKVNVKNMYCTYVNWLVIQTQRQFS